MKHSEEEQLLHLIKNVEQFAQAHRLTVYESSRLLSEFDGDIEQAQVHLEQRLRPAEAVWESLKGRVGFRRPISVRMPLPAGNAIYHKLLSLTLCRAGDSIEFQCCTQFLAKPGAWNDGTQCTADYRLTYLRDVKTLEDIFEHWRELRLAIFRKSPGTKFYVDNDLENDPSTWTLQDFLACERTHASRCGTGSRVSFYNSEYGGSPTIYLLSPGGVDGTLVTNTHLLPFDEDFLIGRPDEFSDLPFAEEQPFEFLSADS